MSSIDVPRSPWFRLQLFIARARFFSFSLLVHIVIVVLGGSVVLFRSVTEPPDFVSGDGSLVTDVSTMTPPPPAPEMEQTTMTAPTPPSATAPSVEAIVSSTTTPVTFSFPNASQPNTNALTAAVDRSLAGKIAGMGVGAGAKGGTTRMLGQKEKVASAFTGTFYDLKQTRARKPTGMSPDDYHKVFRKYIAENWKESILREYYRAKDSIYATQIFTPDMPADEGPRAFGVEKEVQPSRWLVHYRARVSPPQDGIYHFVGAGDDVMLVRFDGKLVLDRCWHQHDEQLPPEQNYLYGWTAIPNGFGKGTAIHVKAGEYYNMDVLIGEEPGGRCYASLLIEQEGTAYERDKHGNPILPIFRLAEGAIAEPPPGQTYPPFLADGSVWKARTADSD